MNLASGLLILSFASSNLLLSSDSEFFTSIIEIFDSRIYIWFGNNFYIFSDILYLVRYHCLTFL
jgi:hypothetical protein